MRLLLPFVLATVSVIGCSTESDPETVTSNTDETTTNENTEMADSTPQDSATPDNGTEAPVFVIDVRSKEEWDTGHVETAAHIPHTEIAERIAEVTTDKSAKIMIYCAAGGRAGKAKEVLEGLGYTTVENGGGYDDIKDKF